MFIRKLHLTNFKNHEKKVFSFNEKMIAFVGLNGVGKTNILDAIYFLCLGKSYFNTSDKYCIKHEEGFFRLEMQMEEASYKKVVITFEKAKKKIIAVDDFMHQKNSLHVGIFPAVILTPDDNMMILGGSEERRRFMDMTISQISQDYLQKLLRYNTTLKQRNAFLKMNQDKVIDRNLLAIYNDELVCNAQMIFEFRKNFIEQIQEYFEKSFQFLASKNEGFSLHYKSDLQKDSLQNILSKSLDKDLFLGRTSSGIHKDDVIFSMKDAALKDFASQGQQKTFLLALKLTQFNFLKAHLNKVPLFIIDDIFDKLDPERSKNLIQFLNKEQGQVFISNTDKNIFQELMSSPIQIIEIQE